MKYIFYSVLVCAILSLSALILVEIERAKPQQVELVIKINPHGNIEFETPKCWGVVNPKKKTVYQRCN